VSNNCLHIAVVGVLISVVSGCVVDRISLVDTNQVTVVKQESEKIKILWTDVYQKDGHTWVYGALKQKGYRPSMPIKTHVDVQVLSEDGSILYEAFSEDIYVPRNQVGKGPDWKRFRVKLSENLPADSRVNIQVHTGSHKICAG